MEMQQFADLMREVIREEIKPILVRMDQLEQRLDKLDQRMDQLEQRMDKLDQRMDQLEQRMDTLERTQQDNMSEIRSHFKHLDEKSNTVHHVIAKLSTRYMYTEAEVERIKEMLQ